jgi:hypothetical protein
MNGLSAVIWVGSGFLLTIWTANCFLLKGSGVSRGAMNGVRCLRWFGLRDNEILAVTDTCCTCNYISQMTLIVMTLQETYNSLSMKCILREKWGRLANFVHPVIHDYSKTD